MQGTAPDSIAYLTIPRLSRLCPSNKQGGGHGFHPWRLDLGLGRASTWWLEARI
jgi:hypothetical protein